MSGNRDRVGYWMREIDSLRGTIATLEMRDPIPHSRIALAESQIATFERIAHDEYRHWAIGVIGEACEATCLDSRTRDELREIAEWLSKEKLPAKSARTN